MLGLGALERSPLRPLEAPVSRAVSRLYPVLQVHLSNELESSHALRSHLGRLNLALGQGAPEGQEREETWELGVGGEDPALNRTPASELSSATKNRRIQELSGATDMLGAVERETPVEVSTAQRLLLQESVEPSALQIRTEFLEISLRPLLPSQPHRKDVEGMSESVPKLSGKAAGMVAAGTEALLHSEQSERVSILQPDTGRSKSPGLGKPGPGGEVSDTCSLIPRQPQTAADNPTSGVPVYQQCNTSPTCTDQQCPDPTRKDGGDASIPTSCLKDENVLLQLGAFHSLAERSSDPLSGESAGGEDAFITVGSVHSLSSSCSRQVREDHKAAFLSLSSTRGDNRAEKLDGKAQTPNAEDCLQHTMPRDKRWSSGTNLSDRQATTELPSIKDNNYWDSPAAWSCSTLAAEAAAVQTTSDVCMDIRSHSAPLLSKGSFPEEEFNVSPKQKESKTEGILEETLSSKSNPSPLLDRVQQANAKALDTHECSSLKSTDECLYHHFGGSSDCPEHLTRARELVESVAQSTDVQLTLPVPATCPRTDNTSRYSRIKSEVSSSVDHVVSDTPDGGYADSVMTEEQLLQMEDAHQADELEDCGEETYRVPAPRCENVSAEQTAGAQRQNGRSTHIVSGIATRVHCRTAHASTFRGDTIAAHAQNEGNTRSSRSRETGASELLPADGISTEIRDAEDPNGHVCLHPTQPSHCGLLDHGPSMLSSEMPKALKQTHLKTSSVKDVPCQTEDSGGTSLGKPRACTPVNEATSQCAHVPYRDILGLLVASPGPATQSTEEPETLISSKVPSQHLKSGEGGTQTVLERCSPLTEQTPADATVGAGAVLQLAAGKGHELGDCETSQSDGENVCVGLEEHVEAEDAEHAGGGQRAARPLSQALDRRRTPPSECAAGSASDLPTVGFNVLAGPVADGSGRASSTELPDVMPSGDINSLQADSANHQPLVICPVDMDRLNQAEPLAAGTSELSDEQSNGASPEEEEKGKTLPAMRAGDSGQRVAVLPANNSAPALSVRAKNRPSPNKDSADSSQFNMSNHADSLVTEEAGEMHADLSPLTDFAHSNNEASPESANAEDCASEVPASAHETEPVSLRTASSDALSEKSLRFTLTPGDDDGGVSAAENLRSVRPEEESPAEDDEGRVTRKRVCAVAQEIGRLGRSLEQESLTKLSDEIVNRSTGSDQETCRALTPKNIETLNHVAEQRTECQSDTSSRSREAKRPKISKEKGVRSRHARVPSGLGNVDLLNCARMFPANATSLCPHPVGDAKKFPSAFRSGSRSTETVAVKRQPDRKCKSFPVPEHVRVTRRPNTRQSAARLIDPSERVTRAENVFPGGEDPAPKPLIAEGTWSSMSHKHTRSAAGTSYMKHTSLRKCTRDQALLQQLSSIAGKLMAPWKSSCQRKSPSGLMDGALFDGVRLQSRKLLEVFSCIKMKLSSRSGGVWSDAMSVTAGREPLISQHMDLYPASPSQTGVLHPSDRFPLRLYDFATFPISFHMKLDSRQLPDFVGFSPPHRALKGPPPTTQSAQPTEWTLSVFLSPHAPAESENVNLAHRNPHLRALEAASSGSDHRTSIRRRSGCSMLGLHTVLALSSPGCYRFWTRKRNLGSRFSTVQKLSVAQFAQGLKGLRPQDLHTRELVSSLPYTLGRVISTWSQHGPSASSSVCATPHANCCLSQPSPDMGIRRPDPLPLVPALLLSTAPPGCDAHSEVKEPPSLALIPKTCQHQDDLVPPFGLSPPKTPVRPFEQREALPVSCIRVQSSSRENAKEDQEKKPQRVSQIRIRKAVPKPDPNLTPMGLPKPKRLNKKEFSLEDIYTNKNYKSPPAARSLETIFEEPKEKNGVLISVSQQKRKRVLEFQDFTVPRKRRARGKGKAPTSCTRGRKAATEGQQLDALLVQKLKELEVFLQEEKALESVSGAAEIPS